MTSVPTVFWGEIAPWAHVVDFYEQDESFLDGLAEFTGDGLRGGDSVIVIATPPHMKGLERRLLAAGLDLDRARERDRYIALDAITTLESFMREGWPDEQKFSQVIRDVLARARREAPCKVRAFGEMVALLWAAGHQSATVRLEQLWHRLCENEGLSLLCAYPKLIASEPGEAVKQICEAHSQVLGLDDRDLAATPSQPPSLASD